jgi:hypothetical protein
MMAFPTHSWDAVLQHPEGAAGTARVVLGCVNELDIALRGDSVAADVPPILTLLHAGITRYTNIRRLVKMAIFREVCDDDDAAAKNNKKKEGKADDERSVNPLWFVGKGKRTVDPHPTQLRALLTRHIMGFDWSVKQMLSEFLWLLFDKSPAEYTRILGFGISVGLLAEKGLPGFAHMKNSAIDLDSLASAAAAKQRKASGK